MFTPGTNLFTSPTKGDLSLEGVAEEISIYINKEPAKFYRVVIGTDSQGKRNSGNEQIDYVSAIVVHRVGRGAIYFWRKEKQVKHISLKEKIYTETTMSLGLASEFVPMMRGKVSPTKYDFEIHIDVGPLGPTRDMIKEVVGMVQGSGYTAKYKPESWGASSVADKHT
ncbi:ribonuclease H-like YkuK family protein [Candidatus Microgenomates bacterium]|nr:ribonuclease H-like YkuK family protein [Candidatus Microgenomates bacterium]